jgi:hypothetical protein
VKLDYKEIQEIDKIESYNDKVLASALYYANSGLYVIPIRPNEKSIPPKKTGLSYNSASKNPKTVKKWYTGAYEGWNIGLCCGHEDGLFVLDIDSGEKNGFEAFGEMVRDHGKLETAKQTTPNGGEHYVFKWFENGRSSTSKIASGIDTRGGKGVNGSHIVVWPSKINGKMYKWEQLGPILPTPDWLEDLMGVPWDSPSDGGGRGNENVDDEAMETHFSPKEIWNMLKCVNPDGLEYEEWLQIGQAIHSQHPDETGLRIWDKWSAKGKRYEDGECAARWNGFKSYGPIRVGTLIHYAQQGGYQVKPNVTDIDFGGRESEYEDLIAELNKEWGLAVVGNKVRVIGSALNSDPEEDLRMLSIEDFKLLTMNKKVAVQTAQGTKAVPISQIWLADEDRKEFRGGVHFRPDKPREYESTTGLTYNMWSGWTVEPAQGDWTLLREHIKNVLCCGNEDHFNWVLDWMADLYQDPANPKGCAVVMHGVEGCGKGTFVEAMGRTMGRHYKHLTQESHLTGNFNGHLQDALLVFADEVTYGGSRKTAGNLKAMVTESKLMVERKGVDAYSFRNCGHICIASNEDWFIPAGPQSRRWFVLECAPDMAGNKKYFENLYAEMGNGGIEAMMAELLQREITSNLQVAPVTKGLENQREKFAESRGDSIQTWLYDCIESESIDVLCYEADDMEEIGWPKLTGKADLYNAYKNWVVTSSQKADVVPKVSFYTSIVQYGFVNVRPRAKRVIERNNNERLRMFEIPTIDMLRGIYSKITGIEL